METQEEQEIVVLPHFKPEEVEALKVEHERRTQLFKGRGLFDNDEERIRDAVQREQYWLDQLTHLEGLGITKGADYDHAQEELAHCYFTQGRIGEALELAKSPERIAHYESIHAAIVKDDDKSCKCETPNHVVGRYPSARHSGRMMDINVCPECKTVNIR